MRSGSIIPVGGDIQSTAEESAEPVTILVYGGRNGAFTLYEDEGVNYNYEKGQFAKIPLTYDNATSTLTIGDRQGEYPGMKARRSFNVVKIDAAHPVANPVKAKGKTVEYDGAAVKIQL